MGEVKRFYQETSDLGEGPAEEPNDYLLRLQAHVRGSNSSVWRRRRKCQLLLLDLGQEVTPLGPLMILGIPFFRQYYTTFTNTPGNRSVHIAHSNDYCGPTVTTEEHAALRKRRRTPSEVDLAAVRAPTLPLRLGDQRLL